MRKKSLIAKIRNEGKTYVIVNPSQRKIISSIKSIDKPREYATVRYKPVKKKVSQQVKNFRKFLSGRGMSVSNKKEYVSAYINKSYTPKTLRKIISNDYVKKKKTKKTKK